MQTSPWLLPLLATTHYIFSSFTSTIFFSQDSRQITPYSLCSGGLRTGDFQPGRLPTFGLIQTELPAGTAACPRTQWEGSGASLRSQHSVAPISRANTALLGNHTQLYGHHQLWEQSQHIYKGTMVGRPGTVGVKPSQGLFWLLPKQEVISICTKMHTV